MYNMFEDSNKIVPLTSLNKYLYTGKSAVKVTNINNNSKKFLKNIATKNQYIHQQGTYKIHLSEPGCLLQ